LFALEKLPVKGCGTHFACEYYTNWVNTSEQNGCHAHLIIDNSSTRKCLLAFEQALAVPYLLQALWQCHRYPRAKKNARPREYKFLK